MMLFRKLFATTTTKYLPQQHQRHLLHSLHYNPSKMLMNSYRFFGAHTGYTQSGYTSQI